ncbi:MAG: L-ribulose-5-phosphate 4-epimerase [Anaerolineae bacterium]
MLEELKRLVFEGNMLLPRNNLVSWTSGNVSGRDPASGLVVIKPSGVSYDELSPEKMVVLDTDGKMMENSLLPSVDAPTHLYVYRNLPDVMGITHTHSPFATAFAAVGRPIPVYLTAIADEFGQAIPLGAYEPIGEEEIGKEILRSIGSSPAILMKNHGVFTIGRSVMAAVKSAVMTEDVARTVFYALQLGQPDEIPPDEVARGHRRYIEKYGQKKLA